MKKKSLILIAAVFMMIFSFSTFAFADEPAQTDTSESIQIQTGWNSDRTSYFDENGNAVTGVVTIEDKMYWFDSAGIIKKNAYKVIEGSLYCFDSESGAGSVCTAEKVSSLQKMDDGKTYYICADGKIYMPAKAGVRKMDNGSRYYFYSDGHVYVTSESAIKKIGSRAYYFRSDSSVRSNGTKHTMKVDGKTYYVSSYGYLLTGWQKINGATYWFSTSTYTRFENRLASIGGNRYWFGKDGKMKKSVWKYNDSGYKKYYFASNGKMVRGTSKYIGGYKYYFNKNGVLQRNLIKYKGFNWVASHAIKISVNRTKNTLTIYAKDGNRGYTIPVVAFACTVGTSSRPTDKGTFYTGSVYRWKTLGGRTPEQDNGEEVYGQYVTHFNGAMYFHSVCYWEDHNNRTLITSAYNNLGNAGSHGCVRLRCGDAYTVYRLAARKSCMVVVYDSKYAGPFGKPVYKKISTNYDPTDPNI